MTNLTDVRIRIKETYQALIHLMEFTFKEIIQLDEWKLMAVESDLL